MSENEAEHYLKSAREPEGFVMDSPESRAGANTIPLPHDEISRQTFPHDFFAERIPKMALEGVTRAEFIPLYLVKFVNTAYDLYCQSHTTIL